jgi:hypothetical protein
MCLFIGKYTEGRPLTFNAERVKHILKMVVNNINSIILFKENFYPFYIDKSIYGSEKLKKLLFFMSYYDFYRKSLNFDVCRSARYLFNIFASISVIKPAWTF